MDEGEVDTVSAIAATEAALRKVGLPDEFRIDLRRLPSGAVDAVAVSGCLTKLSPKELRRIDDDLRNSKVLQSVRVRRNRISIRFSQEFLGELDAAFDTKKRDHFDLRRHLHGKRFLVDFCDPNANKALHVGHLRNIALGHSISSLFKWMGAEVQTQSVVCDIGRNVCEAMAGISLRPPEASDKQDAAVGRAYATYVSNRSGETTTPAPYDQPIARELEVANDKADLLMKAWLDGDAATHDLWKRVVAAVLEGHSQTLGRLGVHIDTLRMESSSLPHISSWVKRGLGIGILKTMEDGAVVYRTGHDSYPHMLLVRPDGFPTEHMRALIIWEQLQPAGKQLEACLHYMGQEWLPTTILREEALTKMGPCPLMQKYKKISHGMVTVRGSKMKSSDGAAILIDDLADHLEKSPEIREISALSDDRLSAIEIVRLVLFGSFVTTGVQSDVAFDPKRLIDEEKSGGMIIASALARAHQSRRQAVQSIEVSDDLRFVLLQADRFRGFAQRAAGTYDIAYFFTYLIRIAAWYLEAERESRVSVVLGELLETGLIALGMRSAPGKRAGRIGTTD